MHYPNESPAYRQAREALLKEEQALVDKTKAVAEMRRALPLGGEVTGDYTFVWAVDGKIGAKVTLAELFGDKETLLLYSMMYGPNWDNPCLSCTSLVDGFDRTYYSVTHSGAAFAVIAKASAEKITTFAHHRGWSAIPLVSGKDSSFQADYNCQDPNNDDDQHTMMNVFVKREGKIFHYWGSELPGNHVDTVWAYWNLMDMTPQGRPDRPTPPQNFACEHLGD